jgi:betaine-aldehyde dehydrogenase
MSHQGISYPTQHLYYDGKVQEGASGATFQSINPATSAPLATIHTSLPSDIDSAISSAQRAFPSWSSTTPQERSRILLKTASILRARNTELATTETHDTGKPISETIAVDIISGAEVLEFYAHLITNGGLNSEIIPLRPGASIQTSKHALGVCAGIGAWNYPIQIALWKSAPCLAAGNCMVYKPSEFTPLHAITLAEIYTEAGVPPGVFNVVQGGGEVGAYLASHEGIAKVSFTGQVSTGKKVAAAAGGGLKYATLELGGKSPLIILDDADLDLAADGAMMANFYSSGQVCTNGTRVFVPRGFKRVFEEKIIERFRNGIRAGDPLDPNTNFGPLVSRQHWNKVREYLKHGIEKDRATYLSDDAALCHQFTDHKALPEPLRSGFWQFPSIFTDCTDDMKIVREEIFGPVMCILYYDTIHEVIQRANDTKLGLAAGVFTSDTEKGRQICEQLNAGICWINTWGESPAEMSVGGWGESGLGVENGKRGLEAWIRTKSTLVETERMASVFT